MSGCFGNDPEDRARERELDRYLAEAYGDDDEEDDEPDEDELSEDHHE